MGMFTFNNKQRSNEMEELHDLILYENENTRLDFKRDQYRKENYTSLLKDVLSMANAFTTQDRYIIFGLKPKSIEDRGLKGIDEIATDAATYQQLIYENIEPEISIDYYPFPFDEFKLCVLRITNCSNPPYLMKKDYGSGKNKLIRGDGFIRKGTHQTRLTRSDFDKMVKSKLDEKFFIDEVLFSFIADNKENELELRSFEAIKRPSQIKKEKITKILEEKKEEQEQNKKFGIPNMDSVKYSMDYMNAAMTGSGIPYRSRSIETLEEDLKDVENTYFKHDLYEIFENNSAKCNISLFNTGNKYIEEASIVLKITRLDGLVIAKQVYNDPDEMIGSIGNMHYPEVIEQEDFYIIKADIGDIKHQLRQDAFGIELRIFPSQSISQESLIIQCELYAKNIKTLIKKNIEIKITNGSNV